MVAGRGGFSLKEAKLLPPDERVRTPRDNALILLCGGHHDIRGFRVEQKIEIAVSSTQVSMKHNLVSAVGMRAPVPFDETMPQELQANTNQYMERFRPPKCYVASSGQESGVLGFETPLLHPCRLSEVVQNVAVSSHFGTHDQDTKT